ncbi:MAG: hypothetical protein H5U20_08780 [Rhodobacteraceae bacterium]|nr:hypothetical protein [Paracoccaceae bacterium]
MARRAGTGDTATPDIVIVAQAGRLQYEALIFAASLRRADPGFAGTLWVAEPQPGALWPRDPRLPDAVRAALEDLGATIVPFESRHFGAAYPNGNKIEALAALPAGRPFVFFDTDTLMLAPISRVPFDFDRPSASLRREGTWPVIELYGPDLDTIWGALYARFGLDFASSLDRTQPHDYWRRYLYFNAGWFFYRCAPTFGARFAEIATAIRDDPPPELVCQPLYPWLDQIALPLVIHGFGGGRETLPAGLLDGAVSCHYRTLPLLYARESDAAVAMLEAVATDKPLRRLLRDHPPVRQMVYRNQGAKARALFDRDALPRREAMIRNQLRKAGLWLR